MSEDMTEPDDSARIAALQVGFSALLELLGRNNPETYQRVLECLHQTGEMAENAHYRRGFRELINMLEGVAHPASDQGGSDGKETTRTAASLDGSGEASKAAADADSPQASQRDGNPR